MQDYDSKKHRSQPGFVDPSTGDRSGPSANLVPVLISLQLSSSPANQSPAKLVPVLISTLSAELIVDKILCSIYFPCHLNTMDSNTQDCMAVMDVVINVVRELMSPVVSGALC